MRRLAAAVSLELFCSYCIGVSSWPFLSNSPLKALVFCVTFLVNLSFRVMLRMYSISYFVFEFVCVISMIMICMCLLV